MSIIKMTVTTGCLIYFSLKSDTEKMLSTNSTLIKTLDGPSFKVDKNLVRIELWNELLFSCM